MVVIDRRIGLTYPQPFPKGKGALSADEFVDFLILNLV